MMMVVTAHLFSILQTKGAAMPVIRCKSDLSQLLQEGAEMIRQGLSVEVRDYRNPAWPATGITRKQQSHGREF